MIQEESGTEWKEMYQVFNMGHRFEIYTDAADCKRDYSVAGSIRSMQKLLGVVNQQIIKSLPLKENRESLYIKDKFSSMGENMILNRLEGVKARFDEVGQLITDPAIISDMKRYVRLNREYKQLEPVIEAYNAYRNLLSNIDSAKEMLADEKDEEMREMAKEELDLISATVWSTGGRN